MITQIETDDLFKGAYFLCSSGQIKEVRILNSRQVRFLIEGEDLNEAEQRFYTGQAVIDPLRLRESLNYLRDLLKRKLNETELTTTTRRTYENRGRISEG